VWKVLAAGGAKFLNFKLLGHCPLVFCGRVIRSAAIAAGHFDDVAHGQLRGYKIE